MWCYSNANVTNGRGRTQDEYILGRSKAEEGYKKARVPKDAHVARRILGAGLRNLRLSLPNKEVESYPEQSFNLFGLILEATSTKGSFF